MTESSFADKTLEILVRLCTRPDSLHELTIYPLKSWTMESWIHFVYRTDNSPLVFGFIRDTSFSDKGAWRSPGDAASWYYLSDLGDSVPYALAEGDPERIVWMGPRHDGLPETLEELDAWRP